MISPEEPKNLVVSLTCLRVSESASYGRAWERGRGWWLPGETPDGRADAGRQASDYRVFVLDPDGKPLPLTAFGKADIAAPEPEYGERLRKYCSIGAVIPLTRWFDMNKPGDYTVLVTLKALGEKYHFVKAGDGKHYLKAANGEWVHDPGPLWVAKPIKVRVPATPK
jgi:hypothetical protein